MSKHTPGPWIGAGPSFGDPLPRYTTEIVTEWEDEDGAATSICELPFHHHDDENEANACLIAAAPELLEALHIQHACGAPSLYDEEGVEGWRWTHPDGREWTAAGTWDEAPPMHPVVRAAIAKATGEQE